MKAPYTCEACRRTFVEDPEHDAEAEARAAFSADELLREPTAVVCDDCWRGMRSVFPELDARYREPKGGTG